MNKLKTIVQLVLVLVVVTGFQVKFSSFSLNTSFHKIISSFVTQVHADEVPDIENIGNEEEIIKWRNYFEDRKKLSEDATKPLELEVGSLESKIASARNSITVAKQEVKDLTKQIKQKEEDLTVQYQIFSRRITQQYKRLRTYSPLIALLVSDSASNLSKDLAYRESIKNKDNQFIKTIGEDITGLQQDKQSLEDKQVQLAALEKLLDGEADFLKGEISKAKDYQKVLSAQIADLNARQQDIINARSGGFTASIGNIELSDDILASITGFRDQAPGGYFSVFSFGAYSHRKGMSQYGARGRAESGQDFKKILKAYYGKEPVDKSGDTSGNISVAGYDSMDFETTYLYGIAEMPSSWHVEALKAQAVAARTYALRYKKDGKTICTTESCQVFSKSKSDNVPESWKQAVKDTKGQVLEDVTTFYASTHGGWIATSGWDTTDGGGGSNFIDKSFENIGGSPWLYKAWWRAGYTKSGSTCGRSNPWLSPVEMADIVNAHLVLTKGNSGETERISPVTTECWGGNPYNHSELRDIANQYGGISSANNVSVTLGDGKTKSISIGGVSMSGDQFCKAFNLRAPGNLRIPQWSGNSCSGAFFDIQRK